ncbi:hypothetical protein KAR91_73225 [Candidatus Pacearchaeota archaeon]|nr:hypothetical protein [Candidatus Pacearchaeota archaeon]
MTTVEKETALIKYGFTSYILPNGFAVADPLDGEDGYYLELDSWIDVITESFDLLLRDCEEYTH